MKEKITYKGKLNYVYGKSSQPIRNSILTMEGEIIKETDKLIEIKNNNGFVSRIRKIDILKREIKF